jgi:hypothetical protein
MPISLNAIAESFAGSWTRDLGNLDYLPADGYGVLAIYKADRSQCLLVCRF